MLCRNELFGWLCGERGASPGLNPAQIHKRAAVVSLMYLNSTYMLKIFCSLKQFRAGERVG